MEREKCAIYLCCDASFSSQGAREEEDIFLTGTLAEGLKLNFSNALATEPLQTLPQGLAMPDSETSKLKEFDRDRGEDKGEVGFE